MIMTSSDPEWFTGNTSSLTDNPPTEILWLKVKWPFNANSWIYGKQVSLFMFYEKTIKSIYTINFCVILCILINVNSYYLLNSVCNVYCIIYNDKIRQNLKYLTIKSSLEVTVTKDGKVFKVQPRKLNWMVLSASLNSKKLDASYCSIVL